MDLTHDSDAATSMTLTSSTSVWRHGLLGKMLGSGAIAFSAKVLGAGLSYLMLVVFARLLSSADYGHFGMALNSTILIATAAEIGLPMSVMRFYPAALANGRDDEAKAIIRGSLLATVIVATGVLVISVGLSQFSIFTQMFGFQYAPMVIAVFIAFTALADLISAILRAQGLAAWSLYPRDVFWRASAPALALALAYAGYQLGAFHALLACIVTLAVIVLFQLRKSIAALRKRHPNPRAQGRWHIPVKTLMPIWGAGVVYAMIQQFDVVVVGSLLGPQSAGLYFTAQKTSALLGLAGIAGGMVAAPMMASAFHGGNREELQKLCRYLAIGISGVTLLGLVFFAFAGKLLLGFFDPSYVSGYWLLMIFSLGFTVEALAGPSAYLMQMTSLENSYLRIMACCYALVIALQLVFVPRYGLMAAALANVSGVVLWNLAANILIRKKLGVDASIFSLLRRGWGVWRPK
jgi:O-antigen/teichoic acid export membrane protein